MLGKMCKLRGGYPIKENIYLVEHKRYYTPMHFLPTVWMMSTACVRSLRSNTNRLTNLKNAINVNKFQVQKIA